MTGQKIQKAICCCTSVSERLRPPPPIYHFHHWAVLLFHSDVFQYPRKWTLEDIAHQHFLVHAFLGFWHLEVRDLLDKMTLEFETRM
jgi:hypothetical protein